MPDPEAWIEAEIKQLSQQNLLRSRKVRQSPPVAGMVQIDGRQFINFGSNDYLGIAGSQELVLAVQDSVSQVGVGSGASPLVNGRGTLHHRLEQEIAEFEQTESALLFPSGYAANIGAIAALVGREDVVFSDSLNHASIIDGCRLSAAKTIVYPHSDTQRLAELMREAADSGEYRRSLIVTDGLFSMDGDVAKLNEISRLAKNHGAMLLVDEAHATGVLGDNGQGTCGMLGVKDDVTVIVGTLSKAVGCIGGFVAGSRCVIDYLYNRGRSQVYSTALPECSAAAALAGLKIIREQPQRRNRLLDHAQQLRQRLTSLGFNIGNSESQIIPVILGDSIRVLAAAEQLADQNLYVPAIRYPTVCEDESRLRISLSSEHTADQIDLLHNCFEKFKF